uniref:Transmembrane protein 107 n=1 Tax=Phaeomonas parva TaxID=124430 RepID=A0A7S1U258_9STRA|mmetsp:Transcript_27007/g.84924  ORF Transcript_27007/g.84924 Transcript_27007/m.84924 type:complete len:146 (+) Transcript_27007:82-519(+)
MGYSSTAKSAVWRFVAMTFNFYINVMAFYNQVDMIQVTITERDADKADDEYTVLRRRFLGVWSFALICFFVQVVGLLSGLTTQFKSINAADATLHLVGAFFLTWAIADGWTIRSYFVIASFFVILPATLDMAVLLYRIGRLQTYS